MGDTGSAIDAMVIATFAGVLSVKYLLGAMMLGLSGSVSTLLLLNGSLTTTVVVGLLLSVAAGGLSAMHGWARPIAIVAFFAVLVFGHPSPSAPEPILVIESILTLLVAGYLCIRNPCTSSDRSQIDDSTSATRIGSTLR